MLEAWLAVDALASSCWATCDLDTLAALILSVPTEGVFCADAKVVAEEASSPSCKLGPVTGGCDA